MKKEKEKISIKGEKGHVSKNEKSEIAKIVREQRDKFLDKWNTTKKRKEQIETESSSSDNSGSGKEGLEEINTLSNLNLNLNLEEQNLNQAEIQESPHYRENEASLFSSSSWANTSSSVSSSLVEVIPLVLFVVSLFMGRPNYNFRR